VTRELTRVSDGRDRAIAARRSDLNFDQQEP
jgi:hypothetical protein